VYRNILYRGPATIVQGERRLAACECPIDFNCDERFRLESWYGGYELESPSESAGLERATAVLELESGDVVDVLLTHVEAGSGRFVGIGAAPGSEEVE
jgi:hypothetical protein